MALWISIYGDVMFSSGLASVKVVRVCGKSLCQIPYIQFDQKSNELYMSLDNLYISVRENEAYSNVTIQRFCPSSSAVETVACFEQYFKNKQKAELHLFKHENDLYRNFPGTPGQTFVVDNDVSRFVFPNQQVVKSFETKAYLINGALTGVYLLVSLVIFILFYSNGNSTFDRICGGLSIYNQSEIYQLNLAKFKYFNKRAVTRQLTTADHIETVNKKHILRDFISTILKDEQLLSYEESETKIKIFHVFVILIIPFLGILCLIFSFYIGRIALIGLSLFPIWSLPFLAVVYSVSLETHYLITNSQFIVAQRHAFKLRLICIDLKDISSVERDYRDRLFIIPVNSSNRIMIEGVTEPDYYINTIRQLGAATHDNIDSTVIITDDRRSECELEEV